MKNLFDLKGKNALITGSAQGIGNLLAKGLATHGATIVINDLTQDRVDQAVKEFQALGYSAYGIPFDVTNKGEIVESIRKIEAEIEYY
ncbi:SDR family NAD(P)-dependent oxidoreductase [Marinomonas sp. GJ51-6]|uniref:SDR family NAD(P)-dependent oxidoreductase n=1 Tax=Marinomonas sp. GJ51-6 TaxID=2992802 RepID=UPI002934FA49|nr:SDR family NAD(P)-dependent oxidoreductase [Marinomonas sp. GJ51-6]WOD07672.1 SDR family NAD(P)-dependent oxidoreductase [Marinomonas sp. GJ51-6]